MFVLLFDIRDQFCVCLSTTNKITVKKENFACKYRIFFYFFVPLVSCFSQYLLFLLLFSIHNALNVKLWRKIYTTALQCNCFLLLLLLQLQADRSNNNNNNKNNTETNIVNIYFTCKNNLINNENKIPEHEICRKIIELRET